MSVELLNELLIVLRERKPHNVKSIYWNADTEDFSVFAVGHEPFAPKSFNYTPEEGATVEDIADVIIDICNQMVEGGLTAEDVGFKHRKLT